MKQKDRDRMARLLTCMNRWPWPNRNRTMDVAAMAGFFHRMEELQPLFSQAIVSIARDDVEDPEGDLAWLEAAIERLNRDDV